MRLNTLLSLAPLVLAALLHGAPAHAEDDGDGDQDSRLEAMQEAVERGEIKSLATLKTIIRSHYPGDIVHISTSREHGRFRYEFRVLRKDGRLIEIELDAASGDILEVENEE